ncbi:MAG: hypothetical protein U1F68_07195 [Gammaproteobacteria bacterium]
MLDSRHPRQTEHRPVDLPTYSTDGVDLMLIRWMLSLAPEQRLQVVQQNVRSILK